MMDPQDMAVISGLNILIESYLNKKMGHMNEVAKNFRDMLEQVQIEDKKVSQILNSVINNLGSQLKYGKAQAKDVPVYGGRLPGAYSPSGMMDKGLSGQGSMMAGRIKRAGGIS